MGLRWTEEQLAAYWRQQGNNAAPPISEKAFMGAVLRLARNHGWYAYHTHDSRRSLPGYPDLTMVHPDQHIVLWAELKVPGGSLTIEQSRWLEILGQVRGTAAFLWTPEDWPTISMRLTSPQ